MTTARRRSDCWSCGFVAWTGQFVQRALRGGEGEIARLQGWRGGLIADPEMVNLSPGPSK